MYVKHIQRGSLVVACFINCIIFMCFLCVESVIMLNSLVELLRHREQRNISYEYMCRVRISTVFSVCIYIFRLCVGFAISFSVFGFSICNDNQNRDTNWFRFARNKFY